MRYQRLGTAWKNKSTGCELLIWGCQTDKTVIVLLIKNPTSSTYRRLNLGNKSFVQRCSVMLGLRLWCRVLGCAAVHSCGQVWRLWCRVFGCCPSFLLLLVMCVKTLRIPYEYEMTR